ncbi:hypothetical protein F4778DRAFT_117233 [Xylariomycetidae sp. FL2044]|nr:hypothetical protein F4778DRAFT_117233 [Xylariomycetidae sp. FL2044]
MIYPLMYDLIQERLVICCELLLFTGVGGTETPRDWQVTMQIPAWESSYLSTETYHPSSCPFSCDCDCDSISYVQREGTKKIKPTCSLRRNICYSQHSGLLSNYQSGIFHPGSYQQLTRSPPPRRRQTAFRVLSASSLQLGPMAIQGLFSRAVIS